MKRILIILFCVPITSLSQANYGTPPKDALPKKLKDLPRDMVVNHFPEVVNPVREGDTYYWKHNTAVMYADDELTIVEFGAYIYYNDHWNLRVAHTPNEMDKFFGTQNQLMKRAQPYTWTNNWRTGGDLFAGWALWYFIGKTPDGTMVCGYQTLHTTDSLLNSKS